jgi:hypothetical protein
MAKAEIGWKRRTPEGERVEVYVHHTGKAWRFYTRSRRFEDWQPLPEPPLEDWLVLLDSVERLAARHRMTPADADRVRRDIRLRFPDAGV